MKQHELEYEVIETMADTGEKLIIMYNMLVSYIENTDFTAEVYGIKVRCVREDGRTYENSAVGITSSWSKISHIFEVFKRCIVFPDELMLALDELL